MPIIVFPSDYEGTLKLDVNDKVYIERMNFRSRRRDKKIEKRAEEKWRNTRNNLLFKMLNCES